MFEKIVAHWRLTNEVMDKVLDALQDHSRWTRDNDITYKCANSSLSIEWGWMHSWGDSQLIRSISNPTNIPIPLRYRKRFKQCLEQIDNRAPARNDLEFMNQYMDGDYIMGIPIVCQKSKNAALWLGEQGIHDWYIVNSMIWFNNEEDIMAYKLRWED